ncbi:MAG: hypothetical protein ACLQNE_05675 [Thermoguttaceae bacterium]|jgi:hypothetical protein
MVTLATTKILVLVISFGGSDGLETALRRGIDLLQRYAHGKEIDTTIVYGA